MNNWLAEKIDSDVAVGESLIRRYKALYEAGVFGLDLKAEFLEIASDYEGVQVRPLADLAGIRVLVIDESTHMTTGTYKALDACLICAEALQRGINRVVLSSGGNLGRAVSRLSQAPSCLHEMKHVALLGFGPRGAHWLSVLGLG